MGRYCREDGMAVFDPTTRKAGRTQRHCLSKEENKLYTARQRWREEQLKKQKSNAEKETEDQWKSMLRTRSSVSRIFQFF